MKKQLASVSPWILAAACTLLAVIIGAFAVNNYSREKELMTDALLQKGLSVIRFLDTGVRVSMRANWRNSTSQSESWVEHVQSVIDQLHDQTDIHFVLLLDSSGTILAGSDVEQVGQKVASQTFVFAQMSRGDEPVYRMTSAPESNHSDTSGFQVAQKIVAKTRGMLIQNNMRGRMMRENARGKVQSESDRLHDEHDGLQEQKSTLLVELDMEQFNTAVQRQLWQIIILSVVLLLVGVGGWLSLLTLQGLKGSQSRLRRIRAFNDVLVESLPVGLIGTDGDGIIKTVNAAAEEIIGLASEEILGKKPTAVMPRALEQSFHREKKVIGIPQYVETVIETVAGQNRALFVTVLSIADDEETYIGDVLLMQDVSKLRKLETELRRNERLAALGRMAAGVAHELRNPLSSIKGLAVLLKDKVATDPEGRQTADVLVQEVERLNRSISELLNYARPEKLQLQPVSLKTVLEKATTLVGIDAESIGITVVTTSTTEDDRVMVDEDKMNQVFLNLMLNSIQAMGAGGELKITTTGENGWLHCCLEDTGEGIAEENLSRVFDPYFTTKGDGTGLGLALSAKIVEEHGGTISLESQRGSGTKVNVRLPLMS